jgi:hypothetical protein
MQRDPVMKTKEITAEMVQTMHGNYRRYSDNNIKGTVPYQYPCRMWPNQPHQEIYPEIKLSERSYVT